MTKDLASKIDSANLAGHLAEDLHQLASTVADIRPLHPQQLHYQIDFAQRTILGEVLEPQEQQAHWWQTGLYLINDIAKRDPGLHQSVVKLTERLSKELTTRLGPYDQVSLREITSQTLLGICILSELMVHPQNTFVAPNVYSIAQAQYHPTAWLRAIYAGSAPVGFIMLDDNADKPEYFLWRFMIAPHFQGHNYGAQAIAELVNYVKTRPCATELMVSYIDHQEGPANFYARQGFQETGEIIDGEVLARLELT